MSFRTKQVLTRLVIARMFALKDTAMLWFTLNVIQQMADAGAVTCMV